MISEEPGPLAIRVRALRKAKRLTQTELAEQAGISRNHLHRIEAGSRRNISPGILRSLAEVLGVTVDELTQTGLMTRTTDPWLVDLAARLEALPPGLAQRIRQLIGGFLAVVETPFVASAAVLNDLLGEETPLSEPELQEVAEYALALVRRQAAEEPGAAGAEQAGGTRT